MNEACRAVSKGRPKLVFEIFKISKIMGLPLSDD